MSKITELSFTNAKDYREKAEIEVKLLTQMSPEDYTVVVNAANKILETASKYFLPPDKEEI